MSFQVKGNFIVIISQILVIVITRKKRVKGANMNTGQPLCVKEVFPVIELNVCIHIQTLKEEQEEMLLF